MVLTNDLDVRPGNCVWVRPEDDSKFAASGCECSRADALRIRLGNGVERNLERVARRSLDFCDDLRIAVVEDKLRTERANKVVVPRGCG